VGSAIVRSFVIVFVVSAFRDQAFKKLFEIATGIRCGIFHDHETAARVLDENRYNPGRNPASTNGLLNLLRNFIGPFALGSNTELIAVQANRHDGTLPMANRRRNLRQVFASHERSHAR
jgi:hypothetical protein